MSSKSLSDEQSPATRWMTTGRFLGVLYLLESSFLLLILSLYRVDSKPDFISFLTSSAGLYCSAAIGVLLISTVFITFEFRKSRPPRSRQLRMSTMMNLITLMFLIGTGELILRIVAIETPTGVVKVGNRVLLPRSWPDFVNRYLFTSDTGASSSSAPAALSPGMSLLVYDELLGWNNGPNRCSHDGLYCSSSMGTRSPRPGTVFADRSAAYRIALIGDSFTFSDEVGYEESWAYKLERKLRPQVQVLNFGVSGYGIDQAYLRYTRDVRPWHPDIVVLGYIRADVWRTGRVYEFLSWPEWGVPLGKPRFILKNHRLELPNVPLPRPEELAHKRSIEELPFIHYEADYHREEWDKPAWRPFYHSYLFRFLLSFRPPYENPPAEVSDSAIKDLGRELIRSFVELATEAGSMPIIVFFPTRTELSDGDSASSRVNPLPFGAEFVRDAGGEVIDLTPCLKRATPSPSFQRGGHYSAQTNTVVAECLYDGIGTRLRLLHVHRTKRG